MSTAAKVGAFVVGLAVLFSAAFGVGTLFEDEEVTYLGTVEYASGELSLRVADSNGDPVTRYTTRHEKELHLIAVRTDFGGYRHLHPVLGDGGRWSVDADLGAGEWKVFGDFQPSGGEPVVVSDAISVPGTISPPPAPPMDMTQTVDGYDVTMTLGDGGVVTFTISRGGKPVADLQPYLGAFGHLVVLSYGDLDYKHVHPVAGPSGPDIAFEPEVSDGTVSRAFVEFRHGGQVHTATFELQLSSVHEGGGHGDH